MEFELIDLLNKGEYESLLELKGIGKRYAQNILDLRYYCVIIIIIIIVIIIIIIIIIIIVIIIIIIYYLLLLLLLEKKVLNLKHWYKLKK